MKQPELYTTCGQCGFAYARIDSEGWKDNHTSKRVMCPTCGWTMYTEHQWLDEETFLTLKRSEQMGYGAFRLVPPNGYSGYNAFHAPPDEVTLQRIKMLLESDGWFGYLSLWDPETKVCRLVAGSPVPR